MAYYQATLRNDGFTHLVRSVWKLYADVNEVTNTGKHRRSIGSVAFTVLDLRDLNVVRAVSRGDAMGTGVVELFHYYETECRMSGIHLEGLVVFLDRLVADPATAGREAELLLIRVITDMVSHLPYHQYTCALPARTLGGGQERGRANQRFQESGYELFAGTEDFTMTFPNRTQRQPIDDLAVSTNRRTERNLSLYDRLLTLGGGFDPFGFYRMNGDGSEDTFIVRLI